MSYKTAFVIKKLVQYQSTYLAYFSRAVHDVLHIIGLNIDLALCVMNIGILNFISFSFWNVLYLVIFKSCGSLH